MLCFKGIKNQQYYDFGESTTKQSYLCGYCYVKVC